MPEENKKFYITTSIVYTNAPPHCGFALEVLQADVLARYSRLLGKDTFFLTGTDEHGLKIARTAERAGKKPQKFCDELSKRFKELKKILNLSNDDFIRTTDQKRHWPTVHKVWLQLKDNGDIYKKKYKGLYCVGCEAFLTEKDLVDGKCPIHKKKPEVIEEENYFFKLSKYQEQLRDILENNEIKIVPEAKKNEMLSFIKEGLEDVSCSRDRKKLPWGVPVPDDDSQIVYVWLEALLNYLSALGYAENDEKFKKYWPADIHCIGKDITRFHLLLWPAVLLSLNLSLPKNILVHGFISVGGEKMSKSLGNIVCPFELVKKYGIDPVRYFFLREFSPTEDGDFTYEKFEERYNADLASGLGNLLARVLKMAENAKIKYSDVRRQNIVSQEVTKTQARYKGALDNFKFNEALAVIWELISFCDKYIEKERPWEKSDNRLSVINDLLFALSEIAKMLQPFLPETAEKITTQLKKGKGKSLFPRLNP